MPGKYILGLILFSFFFPLSTHAGSIPDTGQTKCYNNTEEIPCPQEGDDFYGQDASYTINPMSYTKLDAAGNDLSDDATSWAMVNDNVTGLMWEIKQDWDGIPDYANPHDVDNTYTWYDSNPETNGGVPGTQGDGITTFDTEQFINSLNTEKYCGYNDWRIPNVKEIASIVEYGEGLSLPAINIAFFPNTKSSWYHSSTTSVGYNNSRWSVYFLHGNINFGSKSSSAYVRAVRGRPFGSLNSFNINGNGTVTDLETGLMWQRSTESTTRTWQEAINYSENLTLAGYDDWRLPTIRELVSLVDYNQYNPAFDSDIFPDVPSSNY